jgi:hypothetical protein
MPGASTARRSSWLGMAHGLAQSSVVKVVAIALAKIGTTRKAHLKMGNTLRSISLMFCLSALALGQQSSAAWKEYVYNSDGFAVSVPSAPTRHADPQIPRTTNYDVSFEGGPFRIAVVDQSRDCGATLSEIKTHLLSGKQPDLDTSSVKEITVAEHPAVEFRHRVANETRYERYVCGNGGFFYFFYAKWPTNQSMPASVNRILSSFRVLPGTK